jgi:hypothetical protein
MNVGWGFGQMEVEMYLYKRGNISLKMEVEMHLYKREVHIRR